MSSVTAFHCRALAVIGPMGITSFIPPSQMPARMAVCDLGLCIGTLAWRDGRKCWDWKLTDEGARILAAYEKQLDNGGKDNET